MAVRAGDREAELIDSVCERVREELPDDQVSPAEAFVRQYYHWVPEEDLRDRTQEELYGAAMAHWRLGYERGADETKIRVYNPDAERDGWSSPHTVLEIVSADMPFIVDSVQMELAREDFTIDLVIHPVLRVRRDANGRVIEVLDLGAVAEEATSESVFHAEVLREPDRDRLEHLHECVRAILEKVRITVEDWQPMRRKALELAEELESDHPAASPDDVDEVRAFLRWVADDHFTFLGYREYKLIEDGEEARVKALDDTGLGILRHKRPSPPRKLTEKAAALARAPQLLLLTKANSQSPIHRPAYLDYIGVRKFDAEGHVIGEDRFLGLYTSSAYRAELPDIPLLRGKVRAVLEGSGFLPVSHDAKALLEILESYPRDVLFQFDAEDLFRISMGVLGLGERQRVRLFLWEDPLDRFVWCLVTIPRDRFNTENRERIGRVLMEAFDGTQLDWTLQLSESQLVRVHYIVRCDGIGEYDAQALEAELVEATRAWTDELRSCLIAEFGEERGVKLYRRYQAAFPTGYRSDWSAEAAVEDIKRIEHLEERRRAIINLYRPDGDQSEILRCKLYSSENVSLSEVLPTFEHMGARVMDERPYQITPKGADPAWVYDFGLRVRAEDLAKVRDTFEDVFLAARRGLVEDDRLNGLVLAAELTGREIVVLRAVARYLRQAGIPYSDAYMERAMMAHPDIAEGLLELFLARFNPDDADESRAERIRERVADAIDGVQSLDEDRILRGFLSVITAMLRTSFFRRDEDGRPLPYLAFKLEPAEITLLPKPRPRFEVFVYSPRFEGVHLRGGKVARGGIRWSDRPEDFRTEILGLMKAQMVKNALIVPVGAKGGFVLKQPPPDGGEALRDEAVACYRMFLRGLLDLTDNIVEDEIVAPERVVRYDDDDDTYLVVAADKGTARFSDIANEVAGEYNYWLGDAFASGGSHGYDHKQMGITARGTWESVKRHFRELGTDVESTDFTVVGIGDMSGDVFGNGMLLSEHIKLVAAFDHRHVFIDPDPDPETSFEARKRLFEQDRSSWGNYDEGALSAGGGVYERTAKKVSLSKEARKALGVEDSELSPPDLIKAILRAPVDLLWNGGVGTYVKAHDESHAEVGDKTNDPLRVDARELRCRVVGEGGNLGFTQRARIEYAVAGGPEHEGGAIYTDSIDNAAGVNCSDHEVNIKILLDALVREEELSEEERNDLLVEMTDAVADQVLYASYTQTQAISLALFQAQPMIDVHARLIRRLEQVAGVDRELEFLPSEEIISDRKAAHKGLLAPELAIVMAYCKLHIYERLLHSELPEDEHLSGDLERYFPPPLPERYAEAMPDHRLRREIIATVVANQLVDRAGTTFAFRLGEETGASPPTLARGYAVAREVFDMRRFWEEVEALDNNVPAEVQMRMLIEGRRLVERATRWLVLEEGSEIQIEQEVKRFEPGAELLRGALPEILDEAETEGYETQISELSEAGVPEELARSVAAMPSLLPVFDIVAVAEVTRCDPEDVMHTYFRLASRLDLAWLRDRIYELPRANRWQALARAALRDDLMRAHRELTEEVLEYAEDGKRGDEAIDAWAAERSETLERVVNTLSDIRASRTYDTTTLPVALREVRSLIRGGEGEPSGGGQD